MTCRLDASDTRLTLCREHNRSILDCVKAAEGLASRRDEPAGPGAKILAALKEYARKQQDEFTGTTDQRSWAAWQRVIDLAGDAEADLTAPAADSGAGEPGDARSVERAREIVDRQLIIMDASESARAHNIRVIAAALTSRVGADADALTDLLWPLVTSYDCDAPHWDEAPGTGYYPPMTLAEMRARLASEHFGDCTKQPVACLRCGAESDRHQAAWIAERLAAALTQGAGERAGVEALRAVLRECEWRGSVPLDGNLDHFYCPMCGAHDADCYKIPHTADCALARALTPPAGPRGSTA